MRAPCLDRLALLHRAHAHPAVQALLMETCRRDVVYWLNQFCWTFDPREDQPHRPFVLYPFQADFVRELTARMAAGDDLLVEKSRDMGISWLVLLVFQHAWLFQPGRHFLLGSRKLDFVDNRGDPATLFEKLRYNLVRLPHWMRPAGFDPRKHDTAFKLINPANGNTMAGESSNANYARGGRYTAILFDEFPFWGEAEAAFASAGQSTPCRIVVGTPYGMHNKFAELRFGGQIAVASLHWQLHPHKDAAWYARQQQRMSEDEVARELDINYHLSLRDRVFPQFTPIHKAALAPLEGRRIIRSWDFGYHCPACLFLQVDADDRLLVLAELVGERVLINDFARQVLRYSEATYPEAFLTKAFEDVCDPAGSQRSDKSLQTSLDILNSMGVFPFHDRSRIADGIQLIRHKLAEMIDGTPGLVVDRACKNLIAAFEGGYRYGPGRELPIEEHPYEDVMDCLRYAVMLKCRIKPAGRHQRRASSFHRAEDWYTGY
ncbi:MAG: hypothetical protein AB7P76_10530 [Candidatus Melainabacteria bacterium]